MKRVYNVDHMALHMQYICSLLLYFNAKSTSFKRLFFHSSFVGKILVFHWNLRNMPPLPPTHLYMYNVGRYRLTYFISFDRLSYIALFTLVHRLICQRTFMSRVHRIAAVVILSIQFFFCVRDKSIYRSHKQRKELAATCPCLSYIRTTFLLNRL